MPSKHLVELTDTLYQRIQDFANVHHQPLEEAVSTLIEQGLAAGNGKQVDEDEIMDWTKPDPAVDREMKAYIAMHPFLKENYLGQHVAIFEGKLIDHDQDFEALFTRIDDAYPDDFVWLSTVAEEIIPTFYHRSPRLVQDI